ncbi:MAG: uncharacterized protein QOE35_1300 [Actinomycetota bacterium]
MSNSGILLPELTEETAPFWDGTARRELLVQKCDNCGRLRFPPRPVCPWCRSFDATWTAMSGRGVLWSWVIAHPPLLPAYAEKAPYNVIVVQLDEDATLRMVGNLDGDPDQVGIGGALRVVFPEPVEDVVLPRWAPA